MAPLAQYKRRAPRWRTGARQRAFAPVGMPLQWVGHHLQNRPNCTPEDRGIFMASLLDRAHTIAPPGYNRFLVPTAALCVHLCIGQDYAFSTFNLPLSRLIGVTESMRGDWTLVQLGWIFSIAILVLGLSAAIFGRWVESVGPRKAMFVAALCFGGGFLVSTVGISAHQLWLVYLEM